MRGVLLFLSLVLVACSPGPRSSSPTDSPAAALKHPPPPVPNPEPGRRWAGTEITYYGECAGYGMQFEQAVVKQFEHDTGIRVRYIPRPMSTSEGYALYQRIFQAQSSDFDALTLDVIWPGAMADHLLDLKPALSEHVREFLPQMVDSATVDGRMVAVPGYLNCGLLYYRTDLLKKYGYAGPPKTWDELEQMAARIQEGERQTNRRFVGFLWQGYTYEGLTCDALEWQSSQGGGNFLDEEGHPHVNTPEAKAAFLRAAAWIGTISPVGVTAYQEEDARNVFQGGNAAFMRHWPYCYAAAVTPKSPIRGKFDVCPLPGKASTLGGWEYGVSKYSRHPEAAIEFVRYETSPELQLWRAVEAAYLPTVPRLYSDKGLLEKMPFARVMPEVFQGAVARPSRQARDLYNEASSIYYQGVAEILQGGDPDYALEKMDRDLRELFQP